MGADASQLIDLIKAVNYYRAGGGKKRTSIGDILSGIGNAAAGAGQGFASAAAPKLKIQEEQRKTATGLMEKVLTNSPDALTSDQLQSIVDTGQIPPGIKFPPKKAEPGQAYIVGPDGKITMAPAGVTEPQLFREPPTPSQGIGKTTNKQEERRAKLAKLKGALTSGVYTDQFGSPLELKDKKDAQRLTYQLEFDVNDPELKSLIDSYDEPGPAAPESHPIKDFIAKAASTAYGKVKNAVAPGTATAAVEDKVAATRKKLAEKNPYKKEYPDAFQENGVWKVMRNNKKYRIQE